MEEPSWGWAAQQCLEKTLKALLQIKGVQPPTTHDIARLLLLLQKAGVDITELKPLRAFSTFAVQCRYDDDPDELGLDRAAWCNRAEALIEHVETQIPVAPVPNGVLPFAPGYLSGSSARHQNIDASNTSPCLIRHLNNGVDGQSAIAGANHNLGLAPAIQTSSAS